jgi:uncharacterized protein YfkK (UPF0435 family)
MYSGICWNSFQAKNIGHIMYIKDMNFNFIRIFVNLQDVPYNKDLKVESSINDWQLFINHCFATMLRGYWAWDNFSKNWWAGPEVNGQDSEKMKDIFDMCKKYNIMPIVCIGSTEEIIQGSWLPRALPEDKWQWVGRFTQEFARYLKLKYKFIRADLEVWNEPNELQGLGFGVDKYAKLATIMNTAWKSISDNYKTHIFSCNIKEQEFLDYLLEQEELLKVTDYISTHILTDEEWDANYIDAINWKIKNYPIPKKYNLKQTLLEMSPRSGSSHLNDTFIDRFNYLKGKVAMYAMVFVTKNEIVHTGDFDEIITYDLNSGNTIGFNGEKYDFVKMFNKEVYDMYEDEKNFNIPIDMQDFADALGLPKKTNYSPYLPVLSAYFFGNSNFYHKPTQLLSKKDFDAWVEGLLNLIAKVKGIDERVNIWYDENGNYRTEEDRLAVAKSNPK